MARLRRRDPRNLLVGIVGSMVLTTLSPTPAASSEALRALQEVALGIESLTEEVSPAVVQIFASGYQPNLGMGSSTGDLIVRQRGSGSGVILDPSGYIVTNNHVVRGADRVRVLLSMPTGPDKPRSILRASGRVVNADVLGRDAETDLAVLKVSPPDGQPLPFLELGDSDDLKAGGLVLAFGAPLGLENSVSLGIVSSTARQLRPEDPMIYLQTDATINPGNSGGPLVDVHGRVVGINTLIFSQSGGSDGIGFAAPSNIVRAVYEQIRENGQVIRGQIGATVQTITPALGNGLGLDQTWGVIVSDVALGGPAFRAGLAPGDLIRKLDGRRMENGRQFDVNLYQRRVGDQVRIEIDRGGQKLEFQVPVLERRTEFDFTGLLSPDGNLVPKLGVLAVDITDSVLGQLPPLRERSGVLVAARAASAALTSDGYGLLPGDVIHSVNRKEVTNLAGLRTILDRYGSGDALAIQVENTGRFRFVAVELD